MILDEQASQSNLLSSLTRAPADPGETSFSMWSAARALGRSPLGGTLEMGGSAMDALSVAGRESARAKRPAVLGDQPDTSERRADDLKSIGAGGHAMRSKADELAPNPETAHLADQVLYSLGRGVTKAGLYIFGAGGLPGAALFGADEGNTTYQRLKDKGVPGDVAAKVGAVTGVTAAVGAALPVGGQTAAQTAALALVGGPGLFMAQEKLSKDILQNANLPDEAKLHDPTDPLGLALSIAVPGVAGGLHLRAKSKAPKPLVDVVKEIESGGRRYGADGELLTSPKGAKGEMQVMPGTSRDPGFGVAPAKDNSPDELARVGRDYLAAMANRYGDTDKAMAAYNAGPGAVDAAVKTHGENWLAHLPEETQKYVAKGRGKLGDAAAQHGAADPEAVASARVRLTEDNLQQSLPDMPGARAELMRAADEIGAGEFPRPARFGEPDEIPAVRLPEPLREAAPVEQPSTGMRATIEDAAKILGDRSPERVLADLKAKGEVSALQNNAIIAAAEVRGSADKMRALVEQFDSKAAENKGRGIAEHDLLADAVEAVRAGVKIEAKSPKAQRLQMLAIERPELQVHLPGHAESMKLSDAMQAAKAESDLMATDADLVRAAIECALANGVAAL